MTRTSGLRGTVAAIIGVAALLMAGAPLGAQELFGTLRRVGPDGVATPASGVVVIVERASDGTLVSRGLTGAAGTWRLAVTTDSLRVRALRIGQEPLELATLRLGVGEARELSAELPDRPVQISAVRTRLNNRCPVDATNTRELARLFADARTALMASQLSSPDGRPRSRYRLTTTEWNAREDKLLQVSAQEFVSEAADPFRSVPVDSLAQLGFVTREPDGSIVWRAPDAAVLTDDRFLAEYCLHLVEDSVPATQRIGIGFRPSRARRDITQIEGVLWLDRATAALQRLEFAYVGLGYPLRDARPRGWVEYTGLPDGSWLVHEWGLRMAKDTRRLSLIGQTVSDSRSLGGITELSGEVLEVSIAARRRYTVGADDWVSETGAVIVPPPPAARGPACAPTAGRVLGTVRGADGAPLAGGRVEARLDARRANGASDTTERWSAVTDSAGTFELCGLPLEQLLRLAFAAAEHAADDVAVRISSTRLVASVDWMLRSDRPVSAVALAAAADALRAPIVVNDPALPVSARASDAGATGALPTREPAASPARQLRVQAEQGNPLGAAAVQLPSGDRYTSDSLGIVVLRDSTALETTVRVQRVGYRPFDGTVTRAHVGDPFVVALERVVLASASGAVVRVVDADSFPIPYAMVHLDGAAALPTNDEGLLRLGRDPRLRVTARVQRIGYAPFDGTLTRESDAAPFVVQLQLLRTTLETVRTVAPGVTMLSRTGFYDRMERRRREAFLGEFITPEELTQRAVGRITSVLVGKQYVQVYNGRLFGRGGCRMNILLDGKLMMGDNTPDDYLGSHEVMAIEIYPSTANAPFELIPVTAQGSCGIVAFWTGPRR
jgi:hypothetical protein